MTARYAIAGFVMHGYLFTCEESVGMVQFQIEDSSNGNSVVLELSFNLNPFGDNLWNTFSGDLGVLGLAEGTWNSDGLQNRLIIRSASGAEVATFDPINTAVSLTDPFQSLSVGDSGGGLLLAGGVITWTLKAK
jgi:hypothetical protein